MIEAFLTCYQDGTYFYARKKVEESHLLVPGFYGAVIYSLVTALKDIGVDDSRGFWGGHIASPMV